MEAELFFPERFVRCQSIRQRPPAIGAQNGTAFRIREQTSGAVMAVTSFSFALI
jgi:hypothetical protein